MEIMNGYTIIAERRAHLWNREGTERVILAARRTEYAFDYVTAVAAHRDEKPTEWVSGHYFDDSLSRNFERAVRDFDNR